MADSLTLQIGVDTTALTAKLAQAQADVRAYAAEVRKLADQLRTAGADPQLQQQLERVSGQLARAQGAAAGFRNELRGHKAEVEGLGAKFGELTKGVQELAGAFGIGFGVERLVEGVKAIAELGEHTKNMAAAVGLSTEQYSEMAQAMGLAGGNAELVTRNLNQVQRKLEEAITNPASQARIAMRALGLTVEDMKAQLNDLPGFIGKSADAWVRMGPSANRQTIFSELYGTRGIAQLAPIFDQGSAGWEKLKAEARATGSVIDGEVAEKLEAIARKINTIGEEFQGLGIKIVEGLSKPLEGALGILDRMVKDAQDFWAGMRAGEIAEQIVQPTDRTEALLKRREAEKERLTDLNLSRGFAGLPPLPELPPEEKAAIAKQYPVPERATPAPPEKTDEEKAADKAKEEAAKPSPEPLANAQQQQKDLAREIKLVADWLQVEEAALDDSIAKAGKNEAEIERLSLAKIAAARNAAEAEQAVRERYAAAADKYSGKDLGDQIRSGGGDLRAKEYELDKQRVEIEQRFAEQKITAAISGMEAQRRVLDQAEAADIASVERRRSSNQITADAAAAAEIQIVEAHRRAAEQILAREEEAAQGQVKILQEVANRRAELEQQSDDKIAAIKEKAAAEDKARADKIDQDLAAGLARALTGESHESIGQAIQKVIKQEETKVLESGIKQLLDASGVGAAIDKLEQGFSGKKTETTGPDKLNAALAKTSPEVDRLGDAAARAAAKISGGATPSAAGAPGSSGEGTAPALPPGAGAGTPPGGEKYAGQIAAAAQQYGVPEAILYNLLGAESGFNPKAGPSSAGARGIAQFIPSTAARYGVDVTSAESSITGAAHYLSDLYAQHGSWVGALGAYSGQGPALATYAAEKNPWGPALVAAARARGGATADLAPADVPALAEGGSVESTGLATVHAGEDVVPVGFWAQIGRDISDFIANPLEHAKEQLSGLFGSTGATLGEGFPASPPRALPPAQPAPLVPPDEVKAVDPDLVSAITTDQQVQKDNTAATVQLTRAIEAAPAKTASSGTPTPASAPAGTSSGDSSSDSFLSGLLGLGAIGGLVALTSRRRTVGTPSTTTPRTVFTSGGITSETPGSATPALVPANQQQQSPRWQTVGGELLGGVAVLGALSKLFGGGGGKTGSGTDAQKSSTDANTQATHANTTAVQANTQAKGGTTTAPAGTAAATGTAPTRAAATATGAGAAGGTAATSDGSAATDAYLAAYDKGIDEQIAAGTLTPEEGMAAAVKAGGTGYVAQMKVSGGSILTGGTVTSGQWAGSQLVVGGNASGNVTSISTTSPSGDQDFVGGTSLGNVSGYSSSGTSWSDVNSTIDNTLATGTVAPATAVGSFGDVSGLGLMGDQFAAAYSNSFDSSGAAAASGGGGGFFGLGNLFGGGGSSGSGGGSSGGGFGNLNIGGTASSINQLGSAIGTLDPAAKPAVSAITGVVGAFTGLIGLFKGLFGGGGLGLGSLLGFAGGGTTPAGPILVGERGPEIITQPGGLSVIPAGLTRDIMAGIPAAAMGFAIARAPAPSVISPDFAGGGLGLPPGAGGSGSGLVAGHPAGGGISVNITSFDGHDVRRVLTSQAGRAAIAEAFARERRGNSRHYLSDG